MNWSLSVSLISDSQYAFHFTELVAFRCSVKFICVLLSVDVWVFLLQTANGGTPQLTVWISAMTEILCELQLFDLFSSRPSLHWSVYIYGDLLHRGLCHIVWICTIVFPLALYAFIHATAKYHFMLYNTAEQQERENVGLWPVKCYF